MKPFGGNTYLTLNRIAQDAGNRSMRRAGRTAWSADDADAAMEQFEKLVALHHLPGETSEETHIRLQAAARGTWYEGTAS